MSGRHGSMFYGRSTFVEGRYSKAVVTTTIRARFDPFRLPFDCSSTALRPFDDLRYNRRPTWLCWLLRCGLNK